MSLNETIQWAINPWKKHEMKRKDIYFTFEIKDTIQLHLLKQTVVGISTSRPHFWPKSLNSKNDAIYSISEEYLIALYIMDIIYDIKLMKGKTLRKHNLHEKTAASVLLKLFISSNE